MKFRVSQWLDTSDDEAEEYPIKYGIQASHGGQWKHCHEDGDPLIYDTPEEAGEKMDELKRSATEKMMASKNEILRLDKTDHGVTLWGDNRKWVVDASTVMDAGEITIDTEAFDIQYNTKKQRMVLRLKTKPNR